MNMIKIRADLKELYDLVRGLVIMAFCAWCLFLIGSTVHDKWTDNKEYCLEAATDRWDDTHKLLRDSRLRTEVNRAIMQCRIKYSP